MSYTAVLLGLVGSGLLLLKGGEWYLGHRSGHAKSMGATSLLAGAALLILAEAIIWIDRIRHLLK
jgi:hypothetical protein